MATTAAPHSHSSASIRFWRVIAMVAPLVALVVGLLVVLGAAG